MKRSSSPENDDGPAQKRLTKKRVRQLRQMQERCKQLYKQVDTSGTVIWSGTVKIPDSQQIACDCFIKAPPQYAGIKSVFPQKQLTIHRISISVYGLLERYEKELNTTVLCMDENTDMMSWSAFCQAIGFDWKMMGCTVLKSSASVLHLLCVHCFSSGQGDYILGFIKTCQANDTVLGILRSRGLLPCGNLEHNKLVKQNKMLKEELVRLHQEVEEQKKLAEKKQEELATSQNEKDMMKKALSEKDEKILVNDITMMENNEALMRKDREVLSLQQKNLELLSEKEKVEEQLHRVLMKDRCLDAESEIFQETNQSNIEEDTDKTLMMETARLELENEVAMKQAALDKIDKMMENDFKCSICSQLFIKTTTLNCSHSFCAFCIQKWLSEKGTCPHCRTGVTGSVRSVVLDNLIETIIDKLGDEAKERRKVTVREREHDISMQKGRHLCSIPEDVETEDVTSTVSSPCSSLSHLSPSVSLMSPYSCPPSSASTWSRSPASIANIFSPPSVLSTNSPSPASNNSNN